MVYDDTQQRVLLFGGFLEQGATFQPLNDLWSWDGSKWTYLGSTGPAPRGEMLAVWDGGRQKLVVHGGAGGSGPLTDTWEWDGTSWTQLNVSGPPPRNHFSAGFDKQRGRVVLFGGQAENTLMTDTWEWDGAQWLQRASAGASAFGAASRMAYSETRKALLMLAGTFNTGPSELWQWSGSAWTMVSAGPVAPMPVAVAATGDDEITAFLNTGVTLRWQGSTFATVATAGPSPRTGASMVHDRARGRLVLFGGTAGGNSLAETWTWNGTAWIQVLTP
jgi:hypothetical protein